ncbi:MAG: VOC family protein [Thaumarchaeota archaeon]|nr:VOC family protein [Nitrososphaerota archaeon]
MDSVVHFEIPAKDVKRAQSFYQKAFSWNIQQFPGFEYYMISTTESDQNGMPKNPGAINGGMGKKAGPLKNTVVTIRVSDINTALEKIGKLGGKTVQKKQPVGNMGYTAYFEDTEGNVVGLWQGAGM